MFFIDSFGFGINHLFTIAMICCNKEVAVFFADVVPEKFELLVNYLNGLESGVVVAGVANHIAVCKVEDDKLVTKLNTFDYSLSNCCS